MATYEFNDDPQCLDVDEIWAFLSTEAYWHRWRTRLDVESQIASAWRVVGLYVVETGQMVGFARAMSDGVSDAYIADVYVKRDHRGLGLGKRLLATMIDEGPGAHLRWFLTTRDTHASMKSSGSLSPTSA